MLALGATGGLPDAQAITIPLRFSINTLSV